MDKKSTESFFSTDKFYFSALLMALGYKLIRMDKMSKDRVLFVFDIDKPTANEILNAFYDKIIEVNASVFVDKIKELKDRLYLNVER